MYQPIIGLEIHIELSTKSKMFCQCDASWQKYEPNTNTCPVCLGLPGALPVPNQKAIEYTIKIAQALGCAINKHSHFDRKHYFYPDLPKGYQISQYDQPIGVNGLVKLKCQSSNVKTANQNVKNTSRWVEKTFRIHRVHLEEDTGKLMHTGRDTVVNFNRSSVPLVEVVTEPDFRSSDDVKAFLQELHTIITYLDVSEADMENGSMRLEPNISVKEITNYELPITNEQLPKYKVEVKNINSFNFVKKSVDYEVKRQIEILEKGEIPTQETRGWDEDKQITYSQRSKEDAHDYRYFPEPDIPPMEFTDEYIEEIQSTLPELPGKKVERYITEFGLKEQDAITLSRERRLAEFFEKVISNFQLSPSTGQAIFNQYKSSKFQDSSEAQFIANLIINKRLSTDLSEEEFVKRALEMSKPKETDTGVLSVSIQKVIASNEKSVTDYKSGKTNALMFLVGQVMREMKGQADAQRVKAELETALSQSY